MDQSPLAFFHSDVSYGFSMLSDAFSRYIEPALVPIVRNPWFFIFQMTLLFFIVLSLFGIVLILRKMTELNKKLYRGQMTKAMPKQKMKSERWEIVQNHMASENPAEWRLAVIEADTFLEEVLRRMGAHGDSLGEMLKTFNASSLRTLNDAWEAHKTRNLIAHKGSSYRMSKHEARRIIELYEHVFREMEVI